MFRDLWQEFAKSVAKEVFYPLYRYLLYTWNLEFKIRRTMTIAFLGIIYSDLFQINIFFILDAKNVE